MTKSQNNRLGKTPTLQINLSTKSPLDASELRDQNDNDDNSYCFSNTIGTVNQFTYAPNERTESRNYSKTAGGGGTMNRKKPY